MSAPLRPRSLARRLALQALCVFDALGDAFAADLPEFLRDEALYEDLGLSQPPTAETLAFARALADGARASHARYDELIAAAVPGWSLDRLSPVDRNILRLGLHELLTLRDTPHAVVIDEAVELAHAFGGPESARFVNGVLDGIRRQQQQSGRRERAGSGPPV